VRPPSFLCLEPELAVVCAFRSGWWPQAAGAGFAFVGFHVSEFVLIALFAYVHFPGWCFAVWSGHDEGLYLVCGLAQVAVDGDCLAH